MNEFNENEFSIEETAFEKMRKNLTWGRFIGRQQEDEEATLKSI